MSLDHHHPQSPPAQQPVLPYVREDGGLSGLRAARTRHQATAEELQMISEVLRDGLPRDLLDPFAPPNTRRAVVVDVLRRAIADDRQTRRYGGSLANLPTDADYLNLLFAATIGWGPAQKYLDDPRVQEVKISGTHIRVQEAGQPFISVKERFGSTREVISRVSMLASLLEVPLDVVRTQATIPLKHGTRMHVSIPPLTDDDSPLVCIRRGRSKPWDLADLLEHGSLDAETAAMLRTLCAARCSFLIVGATGSGKTTLLEALANSAPEGWHVITIEDHTREIVIHPRMDWTPEQVDTHADPLAFGKVAREALRQTPDLIVPGETRSNEAGAILSLVRADNPTMTTIHALSCADGLDRFAACAAMPHAWMYEGRRNDALRDAAHGFDVVIHVVYWSEIGRRVISCVALSDGVQQDQSGVTAQVIPLVEVVVGERGEVSWQRHATLDGTHLVWEDGQDRTPPLVRERLKRAAAAQRARPATAPTIDKAADAAERAALFLANAQAQPALEALKEAWRERHDDRLLQLAQQALSMIPEVHAQLLAQATDLEHAINAARRVNDWVVAREQLNAVMDDICLAAAHVQDSGWGRYLQELATARSAQEAAQSALHEARQAIATGVPREGLQRINRIDERLLSLALRAQISRTRVDALRALVARNDAAPEALAAAQEGYRALEGEQARSGRQS